MITLSIGLLAKLGCVAAGAFGHKMWVKHKKKNADKQAK